MRERRNERMKERKSEMMKEKAEKSYSFASQKRKESGLFRWRISIILLIIFSLVLFINNVTQLFEKYGWGYNINIIIWIGIIGSLIYAIWEITGERVR